MVIEYDDVTFHIKEEVLYKMVSKSNTRKSIFIPKKFEDGQTISRISSHFCNGGGAYDTITVDNDISFIEDYAFESANVLSVVWSTNCKEIPKGCFLNSRVESVTNVENVVCIGPSAFASSLIEHFDWPAGCKMIPDYCFSQSDLKSISNIENVTAINQAAFTDCCIESFTVPKNVVKISERVFAGNAHLHSVELHDNIEVVEKEAFISTRITSIVWPQKCPIIPEGCFKDCYDLVCVEIPDSVSCISQKAFFGAGVHELRWPSQCKVIPEMCFSFSGIKKLSNIDHIEEIQKNAFTGAASLRELDLSSSTVNNISNDAFDEVPDIKITLPYYCSVELVP